MCGSERPWEPLQDTRGLDYKLRGQERGGAGDFVATGWCRVAASVPKCGFPGAVSGRECFSALYNKPADTSQNREFSSLSSDAFTPHSSSDKREVEKKN